MERAAWTSLPGSPTSRMIRSRSSPAGPVRECDGEDPERRDALDADEVRDPMGQDARLAGARSRENEDAAFGRRDRARLLGVEPAQDLLPPRVGDLGLVLLLQRPSRRGRARPSGSCAVGPPESHAGRRAGPRGRLGELVEARALGLRRSVDDPVASAPARVWDSPTNCSRRPFAPATGERLGELDHVRRPGRKLGR